MNGELAEMKKNNNEFKDKLTERFAQIQSMTQRTSDDLIDFIDK